MLLKLQNSSEILILVINSCLTKELNNDIFINKFVQNFIIKLILIIIFCNYLARYLYTIADFTLNEHS